MKDSARLAASIDIIDKFLNGIPLERAFSGWVRRSKFAGSSDRVAIRDILFCSIRSLKTYSEIGGSKTGRGIVIGYLLDIGKKPAEYFTGEVYAPEVLSNEESQNILNVNVKSVVENEVDFPDWLIPVLKESLGPKFKVINSFLRNRAPMFLRINSRKASLKEVQSLLRHENIESEIVSLVSRALEVKRNNRKVKLSKAYKNGYFEFQDINSQLVCELIPLSDGFRVLDFCAGGGGKALALKDRADIDVSAYDVNLDRMKDIPIRSERAGVKVKIFSDLNNITRTDFDLVLCDVPCTGSGAWRRDPEGKWSLTYDKYNSIQKDQVSILNSAKTLVKEGGILVYMTCSFLKPENEDQIKKFLKKNTKWETTLTKNLFNSTNGDGFFIAILKNNSL